MTIETRINKLLVDRHNPLVDSTSPYGYDLVLGAGGIKGYAEIGAKQALDDLRVPVRIVRGVSVGAANATLIVNGRSPREMLALYERERERLFDAAAWQELYKESIHSLMCALSGNPECLKELQNILARIQTKILETAHFWQRALVIPTLLQWLRSQSFVSLEGLWSDVIDKEQLVPTDNLEIIAYCMIEGRPVFYKGAGMNLKKAVPSSGSLPGLFVPVQDGEHLNGDGAIFHYNPTVGLREPAIVIRLGRATKWPVDPLPPVDAYFHFREWKLPIMPSSSYVDETHHILVDVPAEDVAGLAFGTNKQRRFELVEEGYRVTFEKASKEIADGRIIIPKP